MRIKADLHVHTNYSFDSFNSLDQLIAKAAENGIGAVAVTDHNTIEGALRLREATPPFKVIVGQEVHSDCGEISGLFLKERIINWMSPRETCLAIKEQGGLVYLPHPLARITPSRIKPNQIPGIMDLVDIVEVANARNPLYRDDVRAEKLADRHGKLKGAGSDAHLPGELFRTHMEMLAFDTPEEFMEGLASARLVADRKSSFFITCTIALATLPYFLLRIYGRRK